MDSLLDRIADLRPQAGRRRLRLEGPLPTIYAVGDVHGCFSELLKAEQRIQEDFAKSGGEALIVYLGDYVDRGPDSASVIEHLIRDHGDGLARITLCGNHDDTFLKFIRDPETWLYWLGPNFGGAATLESYGIDIETALNPRRSDSVRKAIPADHIRFLDGLPVFLQAGHYLFVHAGVSPAVPLERQSDEDLIWIREPFLTLGPGLPMIVVHGHTPCGEPEFAPGRIGIDTGCCFNGRLTVLKIDASGAHAL